MTIELGLLIAVVGGAIGVSTFFIGRQSAAKSEGERWGKMESALEHIQRDILEVKELAAGNSRNTKEAIRRVHERVDSHLRDDHGALFSPS